MSARRSRRFFARPTLAVARALLGQRLVRVYRGERLGGIISECEAYIGEDDTACHAWHGRTRRTEVMYGDPGHAYVYFTYGAHWMLNIVTERRDFPAAVLIRAILPSEGLETMRRLRPREPLSDGPAKLCQALAITGALNGADMAEGAELFVERGVPVPETRVRRTARIGIQNSDPVARERLWRFVLTAARR